MGVFKKGFLLIFITLVTLVGCSKQDVSSFDTPSNGYSVFSAMAVFNVIPNSSGVTINAVQGGTSNAIITSSDKLVFGNYLAYKNWYSGSVDLSIENQSVNTKETVRKNVFLTPGKFHSLFLYGKNGIQTLISEDNVILPIDGKAKIRITHFNDKLGNINVYEDGNKTPLFENVKFVSASEYVEVNINHSYNFIIQTIDGAVKLTMKDAIKLDNRGIYTLLLKGSFDQNEKLDSQDLFSLIKQK